MVKDEEARKILRGMRLARVLAEMRCHGEVNR